MGLLQGEAENLIETEGYKRFYMHRTSHWLGMDVHDVGAYFKDSVRRRQTRAQHGALTVEPGIYIAPDDDSVPPQWRGIGVRIEDDLVVTETGADVITADIPKTVADVLRACAN